MTIKNRLVPVNKVSNSQAFALRKRPLSPIKPLYISLNVLSVWIDLCEYFVVKVLCSRSKKVFKFVSRVSIKLQMWRIRWRSRQEASDDRWRLAHCTKQPSFQHWSSVCNEKRYRFIEQTQSDQRVQHYQSGEQVPLFDNLRWSTRRVSDWITVQETARASRKLSPIEHRAMRRYHVALQLGNGNRGLSPVWKHTGVFNSKTKAVITLTNHNRWKQHK